MVAGYSYNETVKPYTFFWSCMRSKGYKKTVKVAGDAVMSVNLHHSGCHRRIGRRAYKKTESEVEQTA